MVAEIQKIYEQLVLELELFEKNLTDFYQPDRRIELITSKIDALKKELRSYAFTSEEEEILFFKTRFPPLLTLYIYYNEKSAFEVSEMIGTRKSKEQFRKRLLNKIEDFSTAHDGFYEYCCSRKTESDHCYFLRSSLLAGEPMLLLGTPTDPKCFPLFTIILASLAAYKRLEDEIFSDPSESQIAGADTVTARDLRWTASGTDLIELGYALYESGSINNGKAHVKDILTDLGKTFNVNPGHYSRVFQELKLRKKEPTVFLNRLTNSLKRRLEDV
jgi:hypothetical protein